MDIEKLQMSADRAFLLGQIAEGKTDSGLAQRFALWLRNNGGPTEYSEIDLLFLACCEAEHIKAADIKGRWLYGIYPDGIDPQPFCTWEPAEIPTE